MEKSNETLTTKQNSVSGSDLALTGRRLLIAKRFFAWVSALYFSLSLIAAGGLYTNLSTPLARASKLAFYFAVSTLLYSLIAYGLATSGEGAAKFRFIVLLLISLIFVAAVAHSFGFLG